MNFRNYCQLSKDVANFCIQLPKVDAVYGVPHTGSAVAVMVSNILHIPMVHLENGKPVISKPNTKGKISKLLVIDDSIGRGSAMKRTLELLDTDAQVITAAVYYDKKQCDYTYMHLPKPRFFEWNIMGYKMYLKDAALDIDGVLCPEPTVSEYEDPEGYRNSLKVLPVKYRPLHPVKRIITSRMEAYREITEQWLSDNGIQYKELRMSPRENPRDRRGKHAKDKVWQLKGCKLMIESNKKQAEYIGKFYPCLCTENMKLYGGNL